MFIYVCYFWYDDGYSWEKRKEIIVSKEDMKPKEIEHCLYRTKYTRNDDFIDRLKVDCITENHIIDPIIL